MEDAEEEVLFADRAAGLDIGKAGLVAAVRVPGTGAGRRRQEIRSFGTTRRELEDLADWLISHGVRRAGMEATSDYWKPVFFTLERRGLPCMLYNSAQVKALPGRPKTDRQDAAWLARLTERGLARPSFVPPERVRRLRTRTRQRYHLVQARTAEKNRIEKLLEDGHVKLSAVISDLHGVSGRAMLDALAAGQRDPGTLAQMARGRMRARIPRIEEALDCAFFTPDHAAALSMMLATIDHYTTQITTLDTTITALAAPFARQLAQLRAIPGTGPVTAAAILAETGPDMTAFPTPGHLRSWARLSPQVRQSAGKRTGRSTTGTGNPYLRAALGEAASAAARTDTFLAARYHRLTRRMPRQKALVATASTILTIIWHLLSDPDATYHDLGPAYHEQRNATRQARTHIRGLERLGFTVTLTHPATT